MASHPEIEGVPNLQASFIGCIWGTDVLSRAGLLLNGAPGLGESGHCWVSWLQRCQASPATPVYELVKCLLGF